MYLGIIISNSFKFFQNCFQETFQGFSLVFFLGSLFVFRGFPLFIFTWQELFFATLPDWPYWQKGDKADKSWVGDGSSYGKMLQTRKKSKGRKRVERGQKYGYSNTQRVDGSGLAADASGQGVQQGSCGSTS